MASPLPIILVTCAAGTTGREVVSALSASGKYQVRAGVRDLAKGQQLFNHLPHVETVIFDEHTLDKAFEGIYGIYLLIASPIPGDATFPTWFQQAQKVGVQHLVYHSSATSVPTNPVISNQVSYQYEEEIKKSGIPYTFLRPTFFHQNTEKQYIPMITKGVIIGSSHGGRYTTVDVRDIAAAAAKVFENVQTHKGKAYFLTTEIITDYDHANLLSKHLGRKIEYIDISRDEYKAKVAQWGLPPIVQDILVALDKEKEEELALPLHTDLEQLIGRPGISFEQYIREFSSTFNK